MNQVTTSAKTRPIMELYSSSPSSRPKSLMEVLLARKIEAASQNGPGSSKLFRTDSLDSVSSIGSLGSIILGEDVCRCDDCLLGIVDLWIAGPAEKAMAKKKVTIYVYYVYIYKRFHYTTIYIFIKK